MASPHTPDRPAGTTARRVAAEALGTLLVVVVGCGTFVLTDDVVATALAFGLSYGVAVHALSRVSAHLNPAVTVGSATAGRTTWRDAGILAGAQVLGGVLGALLLLVLLNGYEGYDSGGSMGQNFFGDTGQGYAWWAAFLLELVLTALLVHVVLAVHDERRDDRSAAPLVTGLALAALTLMAVQATGASFNPARSIGPALFAGPDAIVQLWLFVLAPLLGGLLAGATYPLLHGRAGVPLPGSGLRLSLPARRPSGHDHHHDHHHGDPHAHAGTGTGTAGHDPDASTATYVEQPGAQDWAQQEPIIQDGWQWDPVAQEWKPADPRYWPFPGGSEQQGH